MPAHILVTGSTRGIGAAIVPALEAKGAKVVGHGRGDGAGVIGADLSQAGAADGLWDRALEALNGRIDVLVNNAGVFEGVDVAAPADEWQTAWGRTIQINLQASADLCRRAILHFRERGGGGRIINIASRAAYRGDSPAHWHYAASKAGMVGMTKSIARGYAREEILGFAVCPGFVMTGMADDYLASRGGDKLLADIPLGRVAAPDEIASIAAYLALEAPASMTGAVLDANGASFVR
ncbi:SDR family oxidoreductase [Phenylobacterium sp. J426]|uniref:SDR family NAD(P)-dependent oxidoreductase n=1 Tax=Phenylobacterium sp. J426 TaxID=2898439 RepID=UPI0021517850|nr:SDR family oxidoreductase [Phenylobacterium sp. J426]MCR5874951.1 SDR family oxidoreductase [Phenylobacterium sp. J426]